MRRITRKLCFISIAVLATVCSSVSYAGLMHSIESLQDGDRYRVLFITSTLTTATSSDINFYNDIVNSDAALGSVTSSLGLSWNALASTSVVNAQVNANVFSSSTDIVHFFNPLGELLATSGQDLWDGTIGAGVTYDQNGIAVPPTDHRVWTGTRWNGDTYTGSALGDTSTITGLFTASNAVWVSEGNFPGWNVLGLYGLSSIGTAGVPEPSTLILLSLGLLGLGLRRKNLREEVV